MIWAYYRVSTDNQDYNSQKLGVVEYCVRQGYHIDKEILDDGVSGTVKAKQRNLNKIIRNAKKGDKVITSELSRFGRSTIDVLETCEHLIKKGVDVYFIKQGMSLDNTPVGKLMIAIFAAFAELERDLIRQRTIEGLKRARAEGKKIGRPKGTTFRKLSWQEDEIRLSLMAGKKQAQIARELGCSWVTLHRFIKEKGLDIN